MNLEEKPVPEQEPAAAGTQDQASSPDPTAQLQAQIELLKRERDALRDQMVRSMAEAQNIQRRMREQGQEAVKYAAQPFVAAILPVLDNLERALASLGQGASEQSVLEGVKVIDRQLRQVLASFKVERIDAVGKPFDPVVHEAMTTAVSDALPENTVIAEIEPGYTMHGRVVRPARVQVSKKP